MSLLQQSVYAGWQTAVLQYQQWYMKEHEGTYKSLGFSSFILILNWVAALKVGIHGAHKTIHIRERYFSDTRRLAEKDAWHS